MEGDDYIARELAHFNALGLYLDAEGNPDRAQLEADMDAEAAGQNEQEDAWNAWDGPVGEDRPVGAEPPRARRRLFDAEEEDEIFIDEAAAAAFQPVRAAAAAAMDQPIPMDFDDAAEEELMIDHMENEVRRIARQRGIPVDDLDGAFEMDPVTGEIGWVDFSGPFQYLRHQAKG